MSLPTKSEARKIYTPAKIRDVEDHDHDFLVARNGVWGTCSGCPCDEEGHCLPDKCIFFLRYDHQIPPLWRVERKKNACVKCGAIDDYIPPDGLCWKCCE